jgi:hypothetical protein
VTLVVRPITAQLTSVTFLMVAILPVSIDGTAWRRSLAYVPAAHGCRDVSRCAAQVGIEGMRHTVRAPSCASSRKSPQR